MAQNSHKNFISSNQDINNNFELPYKSINNPYCLIMPPPNITGRLHLGHALGFSIQDALIRYHQMKGFDTIYIPGLDHAGLATDEKIIESMKKLGLNYQDRETYLKFADNWLQEFKGIITNQINYMELDIEPHLLTYSLNKNSKQNAILMLKKLNENKMLYFRDGNYYIDLTIMAGKLIKAIESGTIDIQPKSQILDLMHFLKHIEPWCISRQIYWGQTVPIFSYIGLEDIYIGESRAEASQYFKDILKNNFNIDNIIESQDSLDTWFNSSLWPLTTLQYPGDLYDKYYPIANLITGYDILFPWCAKMLMNCELLTGAYPFNTIYLHGLIRDKNGQKFSKSLGNGIDPIEMIDKHGIDGLKLSLLSKTANAMDFKFNEQDIIDNKKFINKLYQAGRFLALQLNGEQKNIDGIIGDNTNNLNYTYGLNIKNDEFFIALEKLEIGYHKKFEANDFLNNINDIRHSFKHDYCDVYLEENKKEIFNSNIISIQNMLCIYLKYLSMLHPFIPTITEYLIKEIYGISKIKF